MKILLAAGDAQPRVRTGGSTFTNPKSGKASQEIDKAVVGFQIVELVSESIATSLSITEVPQPKILKHSVKPSDNVYWRAAVQT